MTSREAGNVVDGWILERLLGSGGNAEVWVASRADVGACALKLLKQHNRAKEPYARFREEIAILKRLGEFPGVLPLIDANLPLELSRRFPAWLAMPIATPIRDELRNGRDLGDVVAAAASIAETLAVLEA